MTETEITETKETEPMETELNESEITEHEHMLKFEPIVSMVFQSDNTIKFENSPIKRETTTNLLSTKIEDPDRPVNPTEMKLAKDSFLSHYSRDSP